jgi:hypothetical protein
LFNHSSPNKHRELKIKSKNTFKSSSANKFHQELHEHEELTNSRTLLVTKTTCRAHSLTPFNLEPVSFYGRARNERLVLYTEKIKQAP